MAKTNNTPVFDWLSLPLGEFVLWIRDSNYVVAEERRRGNKK